jgi:hypothetical protein
MRFLVLPLIALSSVPALALQTAPPAAAAPVDDARCMVALAAGVSVLDGEGAALTADARNALSSLRGALAFYSGRLVAVTPQAGIGPAIAAARAATAPAQYRDTAIACGNAYVERMRAIQDVANQQVPAPATPR